MVTDNFLILLAVLVQSLAREMKTNYTICHENCKGYTIPNILQHRGVHVEVIPEHRGFIPSDHRGLYVELSDNLFLDKHIQSFPCPPSWWSSFCTDFIDKRQFGLSLSCSDITKLLEICLEQSEESRYNLLTDCKQHLHCQNFKSLCSSERYSRYCGDDYDTVNITPIFITDTKKNEHRTYMNNSTRNNITTSGSGDAEYYSEPYNWNVLWALLVLVYIFIFVPCFLIFVIKRSIIDRIRNRFQRDRHKTVKDRKNYESDEPPLIPVVTKELNTPVGTANSVFIPSRPESMASSIGEDFDFPYADESAAVSMVSLLIDEQR